MSHVMHARHLREVPRPRTAGGPRSLLYKTDHPRAIDRYIGYFGEAPAAAAERDICGEALLDGLAARRRRP